MKKFLISILVLTIISLLPACRDTTDNVIENDAEQETETVSFESENTVPMEYQDQSDDVIEKNGDVYNEEYNIMSDITNGDTLIEIENSEFYQEDPNLGNPTPED